MYYRRKILLALLQTFDGRLSNPDLQNLLFLFAQTQIKPAFDFLPAQLGCFSPQAFQDLRTMVKYELVKAEGDDWVISDSENYMKMLNRNDAENLVAFRKNYSGLRETALIRTVYEKYPFYAVKSRIASDILSTDKMKEVSSLLPRKKEPAVFTIGYEGRSVERYVTELIQEDVRLLCDIRKNPMSMKFGFSKKQLREAVEGVGISYVHIPGLGIESDKRKNLNTQDDYEKLFAEYEKTVLVENTYDLNELKNLFSKFGRIALTCFELNHRSCHRSRAADALQLLLPKDTSLIHL